SQSLACPASVSLCHKANPPPEYAIDAPQSVGVDAAYVHPANDVATPTGCPLLPLSAWAGLEAVTTRPIAAASTRATTPNTRPFIDASPSPAAAPTPWGNALPRRSRKSSPPRRTSTAPLDVLVLRLRPVDVA